MKKLLLFVLPFLFIACQTKDRGDVQFEDPEIKKKVDALMQEMTLKEKLGQMSQLNYWSGGDTIPGNIAEKVKNGEVGSFLNTDDVPTKYKLQKIAIEQSRLGIPLIFGRDVIHGYRTLFPIPIGQSSSWNPDLVQEAAAVAAKEASAMGIHWTFAPMIDITRNPKWGRVAETTGEDPFLTSAFAKAMVKGFQGDDLADPSTIASCTKHYVGYGATEDGKDYNTTRIPRVDLYNIYLPPFKAAVDAKTVSIMSAFNDLNGIPTSGNIFTMREILKGDWDFDGVILSDWDAITEMIPHGFCKTEKEAAEQGLIAGIDMEMHSSSYIDHLEQSLNEGVIEENMIDDAVRRILKMKFQLGLFDQPYPDSARINDLLTDENLKVARALTRESVVMLKNEQDILPLNSSINNVAIIGPLADSPEDQQGCWSFDGKNEDMITPLSAFKDYWKRGDVYFAKGLEKSRTIEKDGFDEAKRVAEKSDVALVFIGEEAILSGEAHSRAFLDLPGAQKELISAINETGTPVVTVIMAGRPLIFDEVAEMSQAVMYAWHPGIMGGPALYDLISGDESPSGKLTITFPRAVGQVPIYYAHKSTGRPLDEEHHGIPTGTPQNPVGYRSHFLDVSVKPAYPFGFGLSYADFDYSKMVLSQDTISGTDTLVVRATVKNESNIEASEIVQLYIKDHFASLTRPVKELKGFQRISFAPGEEKEVTFKLVADDLGFYNRFLNFTIEEGDFDVWVASSSDDERLNASFYLKE